MRLQPKCLSGDSKIVVYESCGTPHVTTLHNYIMKWMLSDEAMPTIIKQINERTGEVQDTRILEVSMSGNKKLFEVKAGRYSVKASKDHLFYVTNGISCSWKRLQNITHTFDKLVCLSGGSIVFEDIDSITICSVSEPTFDIEVAGDFPNFFVNDICVHNSR